MVELPRDTIYDILSRMPVKSLARFRCVSKQWCGYIRDPELAIIHDKLAGEEPTPIVYHKSLGSFHIIEPKQRSAHVLEAEKNPFFTLVGNNLSSIASKFVVRGSCNDLLYMSQQKFTSTSLFVILPLRKEFYALPPMAPWFPTRETCGLGYDASSNTFKMVCVLQRIDVPPPNIKLFTKVYDLGTDAWRDIPQVPSYPIDGEGIFAHGCLYWLVSTIALSINNGRKVICFDVRKEDFGLINPPKRTGVGLIDDQLVNLNGEIGYVYNNVRVSMEIWVLKQKKWEVYCRFDQNSPFLNSYIKVVGCWNKAGDILMSSYGTKLVFVYNLKNGVLQEANVVCEANGCEANIRMFPSSSLFSIHGINTLSDQKKKNVSLSNLFGRWYK